MSARATTALLVTGVGLAVTALAADTTSIQWSYGQQEYQARCSACHGASGKGDGPMAWALVRPPSDLTTYADRYDNGKFPAQLAAETIDGRPPEGSVHRPSREMPAWGSEFRAELATSPEPPEEPEWHVNARIEALTVYLSSLQAK